MAVAIAHATFYALGNNNSPQNVTIPATTAGNMLVITIDTLNGGVTPTATGASFSSKANLADPNVWDHFQIYSAFNVNASITTITLSYGAAQALSGIVFEFSGVSTSVDPFDTGGVASLQNAFNATDLGCGSITPANSGMAVAVFDDVLGAVTTYTQGTGWTAGSTTNNDFYETRASTGGVSVGGNTLQASANASNNGEVSGVIFAVDASAPVAPVFLINVWQ